MAHIFIFHGAHGHSDENWFPWLRDKLEPEGHTVFIPRFPTPEHQTFENWCTIFEEYESYIHKDSIFVAHSLGCPFSLRILENTKKSISACFLTAPAGKETPVEFSPQTFVNTPYNFENIQKYCKKFFIFHADNDPYNSLQSAQQLAHNLRAECTVIPKGGHLNTEFGYTEFPELLKVILKNPS